MTQHVAPQDAAEDARPVVHLHTPPLNLNRDEAAAYVNVGRTLFQEMVSDGRMPKPFKIGRRSLWYRPHVEAAVASMIADQQIAAGEGDDLV